MIYFYGFLSVLCFLVKFRVSFLFFYVTPEKRNHLIAVCNLFHGLELFQMKALLIELTLLPKVSPVWMNRKMTRFTRGIASAMVVLEALHNEESSTRYARVGCIYGCYL